MTTGPLLVYDGSCGFCSWWMRQVRLRDRRGVFRFAALDSEAGREAAAGAGLPAGYGESIVLRRADGRVFLKSSAALHVAHALGWPWRALAVLLLVPRPVRDGAYDFVARRRRCTLHGGR